MYLVAAGLNHRTAPLAVRETACLDGEECVRLLEAMRAGGMMEGAILSTCNRTEVYLAAESGPEAREEAVACFARLLPSRFQPVLGRFLYVFEGEEAARHLFTVAAGCDSLVVGEAQVLGQVREALAVAGRAGTAGPVITGLFHHALRAGRRVRTETPIGRGAVSVSHAAVILARSLLGDLSEATVLLVGAGRMAGLAAEGLRRLGAGRLIVASRTMERAERLARSAGGEAVAFGRVDDLLAEVDAVIASTTSKAPVITQAAVRRAMQRRGGRRLLLIDIAVPRDVEPQVASVDGVAVYNVDDLRAVVDASLAERSRHLPAARAIVEEEVRRFTRWLAERKAAPVIAALHDSVRRSVDRELERALRKLTHLPERDKERVRALARGIAGKVLHGPTVKLKEAAAGGEGAGMLRLAAELFGLDVPVPAGEGTLDGAAERAALP